MVKIFVLLILIFSYQKALPFETETSFPGVCTHCDSKDLQFQSIKEIQECLRNISQEECQSIPKEERENCTEEDNLKLTDTGSIIYQCIESTLLSYTFIFDFLWHLIQGARSWIFEDEKTATKSPSKNYIFMEFYRAYRISEGSRLQRLIKAASLVGGQQFDLFWSALRDFIHKEFISFKCYKSSSQISIACTFLLSYMIPGSGVAMVLKKGIKTGTEILKHSKMATQSLIQKRQLSTIMTDIESNFDNLKSITLSSAKNLKQWEKKEIGLFFDKVDKNKFLSDLKISLNKKLESGITLNRREIQLAVARSLTAGATVISVKLSAKSTAAFAEGLTDTLVTKYVNENVISN